MSKTNKFQWKILYKALGLAIGLVFSGFVGQLIGNPIIIAGGGLVLGFVIGVALDNKANGKKAPRRQYVFEILDRDNFAGFIRTLRL